MKKCVQILCVLIFIGLVSARISDRHITYDVLEPVGVKTNDSDKIFKETVIIDEDNSIKWKRRHKRRKKARKPKRGR